ncbi:MAG: hypothetical protein L3J83_09200 [Proteobacteria bacterium]|nr:hypothetical protein [Pseudomonadota bacterium]
MKTIALITQDNNTDAAQWQFDKVMAAIAYDLDLTIIFIDHGIKQLQLNPAWKCLDIYGIDSVYIISEKVTSNKVTTNNDFLISAKTINVHELKQLISDSELLL